MLHLKQLQQLASKVIKHLATALLSSGNCGRKSRTSLSCFLIWKSQERFVPGNHRFDLTNSRLSLCPLLLVNCSMLSVLILSCFDPSMRSAGSAIPLQNHFRVSLAQAAGGSSLPAYVSNATPSGVHQFSPMAAVSNLPAFGKTPVVRPCPLALTRNPGLSRGSAEPLLIASAENLLATVQDAT